VSELSAATDPIGHFKTSAASSRLADEYSSGIIFMRRIIMRKVVLGALAATALSSAVLEVTLAAPATLGGFAEDPGLVQKATVVCGAYSCVRVYGSYRAYAYHVPYY
jgi:hypothetical protein